jgi:hypothetical protein
VDEMKKSYSTRGESEGNISTLVRKPKEERVLGADRPE